MNPRPSLQAATLVMCIAMASCSRTPQTVPEKGAEATPATEPVVAVVPAGEPSDPSLVDSKVTANLDVNAPWTTTREGEAPQAAAAASDEGTQVAAPSTDDEGPSRAAQDAQSPQDSIPGDAPPSTAVPPQAAESPTVDLATSGVDSRTSTN